MIFLFDKFKKLKGTVRNRHTISLLYERERNGLYTVSAEIPLKITDKKTVYNYHKKVKDSDFLGHYDREGRFQLHKIASVDIEGSSIYIKGVHLFFDEAKAGAIIQERRFRDSELIDGARVAFESIGWSVVDFDVSDTADYIFYNVSPLEARAILVETFDYEFDYWLDFDGKNIRNKQISIKREMGKDSNKRYNYGHNVLNIKVEQDYSEIYTAVIGRGKGEDLGDDAYGRRIEYTDVEWKTPTHPMNKPKGSRVLHDENATQLFGYHEDGKVSPRTKVEIFEDIEDPAKLLRASYNWLRENSVPKAVFSLEVPDGDGLDLGDKVHVIYRDIDLVKHTRVTKVVDDLVSGNRDVEFGDTAYFKTDRRLSGVKSELKRVGGSMSSRLSRLKAEFDRRFDNEVQQWKDDFEQAVIDAEAAVEVMRVTMTEEFEAAQKEFEDEFNQAVADAKKHADDTADAKAKEVQDNLDSFKGEHEQIVEELQGNIVDIDGEMAETIANVSDILGRLTVVDGSISGIQGSLSEIEGTLSNTKTQLENQISDARTDLEKSISSTRTELENKIDTTEEALNKVGEDLGNAKTDLQRQLDEARAELDGLEVGGRNLLEGSADMNHSWETEVSSYNYLLRPHIQSIVPKVKVGDTLTFSLDIEAEERTPIRIYDSNGNPSMTFGNHNFIVEEGKQRISFTTTLKESSKNGSVWIMDVYNSNNGVKFSISKIKIEKGNIATDWTPAPEDTEQKITNINQTLTNIEGELSSKVEQTEVDALKGTVTAQGTLLTQTADEVSSKAEKSVVDTLTGRVSNTESSVTQNAAEIAKRLTKSDYDEDKKATDAKITQWSNTASETAEGLTRVIGRVSQTEKGVETAQTRIEAEAGRIDGLLSRTSNVEGKVRDAELAIEANADGLALRATKTEVEQAIDGIEVGGRNLIKDSAKEFIGTGSRSEFLTTHDLEPVFQKYGTDREYSLSLELKSADTSNANGISVYMQNGTGTRHNFINKRVTVSEEYQRFTFEGLTPSLSDESHTRSTLSFFGDYGTGNTPIVRNIKLELGNKATDWTPAPEDIDASIAEVTDRVTTAEAELVVQAGEISQRATQSELDRVTGRVSKAETSIIQNADEIARRLVKSDYDSDKQATDAEITKWSNLSTETAEGLEQTISRLSTTEGNVTKAQADIKANADEIALKASQSELNSVTGRISTAESQLSIQSGQIALRATKTEVEQAIDDIEVGGRNLLLNSNVRYETSSYNIADYPLSEAIEEGTEVTISLKGQLNSNKTYFGIYNSGGSFQTATLRPSSQNSKGVYTLTFNWVVRSTSNTFLRVYHMPNDVTGVVSSIEWIKLEYGNKATDWTPAPEDIDNRVTVTEASLTVLDDEISSVVGRVSNNESNISSVVQDVNSITSTVASLEGDVATQGSKIEQTEDVISSKVWLEDVANIGANLVPTSPNAWEDGSYWSTGNGNNTLPENIRLKKDLAVSTYRDVQYTFTCDSWERSNVRVWMLVNYDTATGESIDISIPRGQSRTIRTIGNRIVLTAYPVREDGANVSISGFEHNPASSIRIKLERGGTASPMLDALSQIEQKADEVSIKVSELGSIEGESLLTQSDISVRADRILLGSQEIGAETLSSIISVSPRSIDMITDKLNLTGNLSAKGQIESISMSAVKAEFADLFAARVRAGAVHADYVEGFAARFDWLYTLNANIERLVAQHVFTNEVKALSIEAVEADIGSIRSKILTSDVIQASHIKAGTTLIDKIFSSNAMFERMMSKSGFVRTLNTVSIDTDQLTIRRADGGVLMSNGTQKFGSPIITKAFPSSSVTFDGVNYVTTARGSQTFERAYGEHAGRYANFSIRYGLRWDSDDASSMIGIVIRPGTTPSGVNIGTHVEEVMAYRGDMRNKNFSVRLPVPTFGAISWTLEFYRIGDNSPNYVQVRSERCWISA